MVQKNQPPIPNKYICPTCPITNVQFTHEHQGIQVFTTIIIHLSDGIHYLYMLMNSDIMMLVKEFDLASPILKTELLPTKDIKELNDQMLRFIGLKAFL